MLSNRSASPYRECRYGSAVSWAQSEDEVLETMLKLDVPALPTASQGCVNNPSCQNWCWLCVLPTTGNSADTIFSKLIYPESCSAAPGLLHAGAESLGAGKCPVQVLTCPGEWGDGEQPEPAGAATSAPGCLPAVISKSLFLFVTHQELDWIQEAATFTKNCKSQPESPNFWAITKSCLAAVEAVFIFPAVRRNC